MEKIMVLVMVMLAMTANVFGAALDNNNVGTRGTGMASALTAIVNDGSAVYYNPAGLAMIPNEKVNLEALVVFGTTDYKMKPACGTTIKSNEPILIPQFFGAKAFGNLGVGVGLYVPFGGAALKYEDFMGPDTELFTSIGTMALSAGVGYKLMPSLSVGLSGSMYMAMYDQKMPEAILLPVPPFFDLGELDTSLATTAAGFNANLGLIFKPSETWNLGLSLKTPAALKISGKTTLSMSDGTEVASLDSEAELTLPLYLTLGVGNQVTENFLISLDVWYQMYSTLDKMTITTDGVAAERETHYKDAIQVGLGAEWQATELLTIRAGAKYSLNATEDDGLSPLSIDNDNVTLGLSAGYDVVVMSTFEV